MRSDSIRDSELLIIIPTYNERENLPKLVGEIRKYTPNAGILIVDDNSPDGTGELAEELKKNDPNLDVLHRAGKLGLGTAYIEGFKYALKRDFKYVQQMDCDFSHRPEDLPRFLDAIQEADLVLGSRYVPGGKTVNWPWYRKLLSFGGSLYARTVLGVKIRDLTGGFKCFRREVLQAIPLEQVRATGYSFQIEMTWRALQAGFIVKEIPITFVEREQGSSKMNKKIIAEALLLCWKLRFESKKGK